MVDMVDMIMFVRAATAAHRPLLLLTTPYPTVRALAGTITPTAVVAPWCTLATVTGSAGLRGA